MRPTSFLKQFHKEIICGEKTQTRRPIDPQPTLITIEDIDVSACKYGQVGDKLQVKGTSITLEITNVKAERLWDIPMEDLLKEGFGNACEAGCKDYNCLMESFIDVWCDIYNDEFKPEFEWNKNPWVWVIDFKLVDDGKR